MLELNTIHLGNNRDLLKQLPDNSIDSVVTDPPYGLSNKNSANRIFDVFQRSFNIIFPNLNKSDIAGLKYSDLVRISLQSSDLGGFKQLSIIKPFVGVPKSSVDLDCNIIFGDEKINTSGISTRNGISDFELGNESNIERKKYIGNYILDFGDSIDFSRSNLSGCNIGEFGSGFFTAPISSIIAPCFPRDAPDFLFDLIRNGINDVVGLSNDSRSQPLTSGLILTGGGAKNKLMLRFDLTDATGKINATISAMDDNRISQFISPKIIRTNAAASSLTPKLQPCCVSFITSSADGADSVYYFHLYIPHDLFPLLHKSFENASGFMGKKWDYDVPTVELWKEVYRVLKPGGHMLVACGTRTQHRMACNIEDAGFEIRDIVAWVYGCLSEDTEILTINGWERFHKDIVNSSVLCYNVSEDSFAFHKPKRSFNYENEHTAYRIQSDFTDQIVSRNHRVLVERGGRKVFVKAETLEQQENIPILESLFDLPKAIYDNESHTSITKQDLLSRVYKQDIFEKTEKKNKLFNRSNLSNMRKIIFNHKKKTRKVLFQSVLWESKRLVKKIFSKRQRETASRNRFERGKESSLERRSNLFQKTRELFTNKICKMSERLFGNGSQRRLCYGTSLNNGTIIEKIVIENGSNPPYKSQSARQSNRKSYAIQNKSSAQKIRRTRAIVTPIEYKGNVWCVEVETGAFVARRNGKIFITGNSGFPKSLDISKAIESKLKNGKSNSVSLRKTEQDGDGESYQLKGRNNGIMGKDKVFDRKEYHSTTDQAKQWQGFGTALKPAMELWTLARKPLKGTVAENVLKYGTGGLNIDGCRVETREDLSANYKSIRKSDDEMGERVGKFGFRQGKNSEAHATESTLLGRFPANFIHDGSDEVVTLFPDDADRFFYTAKASQSERNAGLYGFEEESIGKLQGGRKEGSAGSVMPSDGRINPYAGAGAKKRNIHPTVKPLDLMRYLCRLITPPNGIVLDPYIGSGTTAVAAKLEGFQYIGIEMEADYCKIAEARVANCDQDYNTIDDLLSQPGVVEVPTIFDFI